MAVPGPILFFGFVALVYGSKWIYKTFFYKLDKDSIKFLYKHLKYYRYLSDTERKRFNNRVLYYIDNKEWKGRHGFEVSKPVRVLLSGIAVQITFGFEAFSLPHFKKILVYPRQYVSSITQKLHKGEVNLHGLVVFNWEDIKEGIRYDDDGNNLGIHEFAHAVYFENLKDNEDYFFIEKPDLQRWYNMASDLSEMGATSQNQLLRDYAYTNKEEFWAVSAEIFFEKPDELKKEMPEYYDLMVKTFKQDPLKIYASGEKPLIGISLAY